MGKLLFVVVLIAAIWWFEWRPRRNAETAFSGSMAEYLALDPAQEPSHKPVAGPVVLIDRSKEKVHLEFLSISADLRASGPDAVKAVVWFDCGASVVGRYSGGGQAHKYYCKATMFDRATKTLAARNSFVGGDPPQTLSRRGDGYGRMPVSELDAWLRATLKPSSTSR